MPSQSYSDWLYGFQTGNDWFLVCGSALQRVTANFRDPHAQFPSTVLLIGKREKEAARRALLQGRTHSWSRGIAQLDADNSTSNNDHPLLVASLDIDKTCSEKKPLPKHNRHMLHKIRWLPEHSSATATNTFVEMIVGKLLILFIDVVCLFLDDFSTPEEGIHFLQRCEHHCSISQDWKPQVILVSNRMNRRRGSLSLSMFSSIQRVILPKESRKTLSSSRFFTLKKAIHSSVNMVRKGRETSKTLYSAYHLNAFFELALTHVATRASTPFSFIIASRQRNRIEKHLWANLRKFLALCSANYVSKKAALQHVATALMLDSLPPGMHRGLIVLMFLLRRNLDECINQLSKRVFAPRSLLRNPLFANIYDSFYGAAEMEACVKEVFGSNTAFFGSSTSSTGPKVAVTTMTVSNSKLCILSNYNGVGVRQGEKMYPVFGLWYATPFVLILARARATSAAPSYFPAKYIQGIGFLQDGGAGKHNNPIGPAEWESKAIWDSNPDLAVSIGTGFARDSESPQRVSRRLGFRDRFFSRLFRLFNAMLNAQDGWEDHLNRVPLEERHKYFRVNIELSTEPALDDVSKIPDLEDLTATFLHTYDFSSITRALFAAAFFFELHQKPPANRTSLVCFGSIRCRSPDTRSLIERILQEYPNASFTTEEGTSLGYIGDSSLCTICGHYCKAVNLRVYHADQSTSVYLQFNQSSQTRISGFPQSISQFVRLQQLDAEFGRSDHQIGDYMGMSRCQSVRKTK
ncbi:LOW QUALITY PROTEIN: acyl transferase/acyl hydrolase/lysophospholipase [Bipolaris maydis]|nr:LOW QUALITY PROTEIN: acyl transferase/acyl hydrolase/lysophospholipase [Bipolaris maydis]